MSRFNLSIVAAVYLVLCIPAIPPVLAQSGDTEPDAEGQDIEEIIVTGTRIARRDYESASTIVTVDSSLFEQSGSPNVQTMLNTLPQFTPWLSDYTNNRTGPNPLGQAVMDLRGLGLGRTLVLLDGQRIVPSNAWGSVDVNLIPPAIVDRVEVVTGGASAVYGSDAVAGVVNFITRRFTGLEAEASWEQTGHGDGTGWQAGITAGFEFTRGYAYGHLSYAERDPVMQADRSFSELALGYDEDLDDFKFLGSFSLRQGLWDQVFSNLPSQAALDAYFAAVDPTYTPGAVTPFSSWMGFNPDGSPFSTDPVYNFTGDMNEPLQPVEFSSYSYNYAPVNYLRLPVQRTNFFGRAGVDLGPDAELFVQALWANYSPDRQLAPTPMWSVWISTDNPHVHPALAALAASRPDPDMPLLFGKRMTDLGPRQQEADYDVLQIVLGMKGGLGVLDDWHYDLYASWGTVDTSDKMIGGVSRAAFEELSMAPDAGASICGGSGMNPFGINSISPECGAYIRRDAAGQIDIRQIVGEASLAGPLVDLPAGEARMAFGLLYKQDRYENAQIDWGGAERYVDALGFERHNVVGLVGVSRPIIGETRSTEVFVEASVPLLADVPLARSLEATLGYRFADHSNAGDINAWKAEAIWQISEPLTIRSSYQQAVRAPDFISLFTPQVTTSYNWFQYGEPCESTWGGLFIPGAQEDPDVAALCVAQGIPEDVLPDFVDTNRYAEGLTGGNPELGEETAETFTAGLVIRPSWEGLAGLQVSIDYYRIEVDDVIAYLGFPLHACFDRAFNPSLDPGNVYCQRFQRDPLTFQIVDIVNTAINMSRMSVSGYDFQVDYALDAGPGQLHLYGLASYKESATQKAAPGSPEQEYAGKATGASVTAQSAFFNLVPRLKVSAGAGYVVGSYDVNLRWRYLDGADDDWITDFRLPSRQYLDLTFGVTLDDGVLEGFQFRGGITNLTDAEPVIYPSNVEANTDSSAYDVLGRRYFVRLNYRF